MEQKHCNLSLKERKTYSPIFIQTILLGNADIVTLSLGTTEEFDNDGKTIDWNFIIEER